jgi:hypothetical protein
MRASFQRERGDGTVEYVALVALVGLLAIAGVAAMIGAPSREGSRLLAGTLARRIACAPKLPRPCHRDPLVLAYGRPLAKLARALAPAPSTKHGDAGPPLVGVDFRFCRRPSCAVPAPGRAGALTASNRRATAFTAISDSRRRDGTVALTYWEYRPGLGWEAVRRTATSADVAAAASRRLSVSDSPALVPLETLPGRNHYRFPPAEEPPWRWRIPGRYPG